jgi:hypothetical protein
MTLYQKIKHIPTGRIGLFHGLDRGNLRVKELGTGKWFFPRPEDVIEMVSEATLRKRRREARNGVV